MSTTALDGVLVADFSRVLAGPLLTMTLADLGADVVKVERPGVGDDTRGWGPPWADGPAGRVATYYESVNRSKRSLTLDLSDPADRAVAVELARRADVLVENFRPGTLARHGLDHESVAAINPGIVFVSITGFGAGAGAALPGYDFVVQAVGGLMSITGQAVGPPTKAGVAVVDVLTGKDATIGVLAALTARARTGRGCRVEINLLTSLLAALVNQASGYLGAGVVPGRMGNQHPSIAPYETLRCADGELAVACGNDAQFVRLAGALDCPGLADDPRYARNADRVANRETLVPALEQALGADTCAGWQARFGAVGVPAGGVNDLAAAFALAHNLGLEPTLPVEGGSPQVRHPVDYSEPLVAPPGVPPALGADTAALRDWLTGPPDAPLPPAAGTPSPRTD